MRTDGTIDFANLDPAVADVVHDGQRRAAARTMTAKARRDAARNRMTIDLPVDEHRKLIDLASELSVPISQLVRLAIAHGLEALSIETLKALREPSRSMRYEFCYFFEDGDAKRRRYR